MDSKRMIFYIFMIMAFFQIIAVKSDPQPQVPCFFIFGDSLADPGNNNYQLTLARVNYSPYGVDFPSGVATGRFNNGPTTVDYIAKLMGFIDYIPPYATATGMNILKGVNYASGVGGIRDETGLQTGLVLSMNKQLNNHEVTISRIANFLHSSQTAKTHLNKCIYYVGMGNEDYINNYYRLGSITSRLTPEQFAQALIDQSRGQLKRLYDFVARKVVLERVGPIGCTPYAISRFGTNGSPCVDRMNNDSQLFNNKLIGLVDEFNSNYRNVNFITTDLAGILGTPNFPGFTVKNVPCCRVSLLTAGLCIPFTRSCPNISKYLFYDNFHPSTSANNLTAIRSYNALLLTDTHPIGIDIKRLTQL